MTTAALLLDDASNHYQQQLVQEAQTRAGQLGIELLQTQFANGSAWDQVESVNAFLRQAEKPDALLVMLAGTLPTRAAMERIPKSGVGLVLLNRVPDWIQEVRDRFPQRLVAGVAPDQVSVGRIQALQAERLAPAKAFVILVTGTATSAAAVERRRGFLEGVGQRFTVHELDGRWSASGAQAALSSWFQFGAQRDQAPGLIVCQNDGMAEGVRAALARQAAAPAAGSSSGSRSSAATASRSRAARWSRGASSRPPSSCLRPRRPRWSSSRRGGSGGGVRLLDPESFPPLEAIRTR